MHQSHLQQKNIHQYVFRRTKNILMYVFQSLDMTGCVVFSWAATIHPTRKHTHVCFLQAGKIKGWCILRTKILLGVGVTICIQDTMPAAGQANAHAVSCRHGGLGNAAGRPPWQAAEHRPLAAWNGEHGPCNSRNLPRLSACQGHRA